MASYTDEQARRATRMILDGSTYRDTSRETGIPMGSLTAIVAKFGREVREATNREKAAKLERKPELKSDMKPDQARQPKPEPAQVKDDLVNVVRIVPDELPQEPAQEPRGEARPSNGGGEVEAPSGSPEAILEAALVAETPEVLKKPINQVVIRVYPDPPSPPSSRDIVVRLLQSKDIAEFLRLDETTREALENLWVATEGVA